MIFDCKVSCVVRVATFTFKFKFCQYELHDTSCSYKSSCLTASVAETFDHIA